MMKNTLIIFATCIGLGIVYLALLPPASNGYGYTGYGGYHRGYSTWYWGSTPTTYHDRSNRSGSRSGPRVRGGGSGSGK